MSGGNFNSIFFSNEYRVLAGKNNVVVKRLIVLLTITFISLGFALGGIDELRSRMDNPFTNWVELPVSLAVQKQKKAIEKEFAVSDTLAKYNMDTLIKRSYFFLPFLHRKNNLLNDARNSLSYIQKGGTLDPEGKLFRLILAKDSDNMLHKNNAFFEEEELISHCGIVVTSGMMYRLGYEDTDFSSVNYLATRLDPGAHIVFIPLLAIVKQLPSRSRFVSTNRLYSITQDSRYSQYIESNSPLSIKLLTKEKGKKNFYRERITDYLGHNQFNISEISILRDSSQNYYAYEIDFNQNRAPSVDSLNQLITICKEEVNSSDYSYIDCADDAEQVDGHSLSFNFNKLDNIKAFQEKLDKEFGVEVMMEQVEARENFRLVSRLTSIIAIILFVFCLASILLYLGNLVHNHISSIRKNLGTMKAMGLPNASLQEAYRNITLRLLGIAHLIALPLALVLGFVLNKSLFHTGFNLFHWSILLAIVIIISIVLVLIASILNNTLKVTPGNLISERDA